ncbi:MAG: PilZ domain-containing protein [Dethiobacteria bacterium]
MVSHLLKTGNKLEIYIPSIDAYYQLDIDFVSEKTLTVREIHTQQKIRGSIRLRLPERQTYPLFIWDNEKVYCGNTKILERREEGGLISYIIEKPTEYSVRERRQYVRVSYLHKLKYRLENQTDKSAYKEAQSIDLSGGGMRIIVSEHYLPGTIITIKLPLNNNTVSVKCKVVWVMKKKSAFWIGLDFVDLGMLDQDYIVQHVFKKMRTQMG